jgi:hypothetical protein
VISREFRQAVAPLFEGKQETFATVLVGALLKMYGVEALSWDPVTIELQIKDDLGVEMPRRVYDKLMALVTALATDAVYDDVAVFDGFVSAINGMGVSQIDNSAPAVTDVSWAVTELAMNDPEPVGRTGKTPWGRDVIRYIRAVLADEGVTIPPKALEFVGAAPVPMDKGSTGADYAGVWGVAQATADEIDAWVEAQAVKLVGALGEIGIDVGAGMAKEAEWTSAQNRDLHVTKHQAEFDGPDAYDAAEARWATTPPEDARITDVRCKVGPDGAPVCSKAFQSPMSGEIHVVNDDGKTVSLYRSNKVRAPLQVDTASMIRAALDRISAPAEPRPR